tara:strand:+ start:277 stop:486 length:210 start_codon:yes stop_codon:yes gene_type:complete
MLLKDRALEHLHQLELAGEDLKGRPLFALEILLWWLQVRIKDKKGEISGPLKKPIASIMEAFFEFIGEE